MQVPSRVETSSVAAARSQAMLHLFAATPVDCQHQVYADGRCSRPSYLQSLDDTLGWKMIQDLEVHIEEAIAAAHTVSTARPIELYFL